MPEALPDLGVFELRALLRSDGTLHCSMPVVIVSLHAQLRFASGFGRLASGPLAALYVPPSFRLALEPGCASRGALALTLAWRDAQARGRRRDMIPARVVIDARMAAPLEALQALAPGVIPAERDTAARDALAWLLHSQDKRRGRCQGHRNARHALRLWSDTVTAAEDALIAMPSRARDKTVALPDPLRDRPTLRRFQAVTGYGPHRYLREYHARAGVSRA
jgi:hypothetical protein